MALAIMPATAGESVVRGMVVDRGEKNVLWIGFAEPVQKGTMFEVKLLPGGSAVANAKLIEDTTEYPYVARAKFKMIDKDAFIPVGAYVQVIDHAVPDLDEDDGYNAVSLGTKRKPFSFQLGAFYPLDSGIRKETNSIWPVFQFGYDICRTPKMRATIGIGYMSRSGNFTQNIWNGSRDLRVIPVTLDARF
jgi:hypothetical protein